jgi:hypothetical protein
VLFFLFLRPVLLNGRLNAKRELFDSENIFVFSNNLYLGESEVRLCRDGTSLSVHGTLGPCLTLSLYE